MPKPMLLSMTRTLGCSTSVGLLDLGLRLTHYGGLVNENSADPRLGGAIRIPKINWILRGYYAYYYQPPPLDSLQGPALQFAIAQGYSFIPLQGERDIQHDVGLTIPIRGWALEADNFHTSARNFLDLDDVPVCDEGEPIHAQSIISLPLANRRCILPPFTASPDDPFLRQLDASGRKWVIFADPAGQPQLVLNAHRFLRDELFDQTSVRPEAYWHRPIVVTDPRTKLGDVIGLMKVKPEHPEDDVVDNDLILVWEQQRRIITGADLLGRLLRGIAGKEKT